jgi:hypothetical protein
LRLAEALFAGSGLGDLVLLREDANLVAWIKIFVCNEIEIGGDLLSGGEGFGALREGGQSVRNRIAEGQTEAASDHIVEGGNHERRQPRGRPGTPGR